MVPLCQPEESFLERRMSRIAPYSHLEALKLDLIHLSYTCNTPSCYGCICRRPRARGRRQPRPGGAATS
jgi:hypothetical protein